MIILGGSFPHPPLHEQVKSNNQGRIPAGHSRHQINGFKAVTVSINDFSPVLIHGLQTSPPTDTGSALTRRRRSATRAKRS